MENQIVHLYLIMIIALPQKEYFQVSRPSARFEIVSMEDNLSLLLLKPKNLKIVHDAIFCSFSDMTMEQEADNATCGEITIDLWLDNGGLREVNILWQFLPDPIAAQIAS